MFNIKRYFDGLIFFYEWKCGGKNQNIAVCSTGMGKYQGVHVFVYIYLENEMVNPTRDRPYFITLR